ncbi:hypothetical protein SAMN05444365_101873 [Micromonospora pattaloongensis]|uniref:Uncharacterized protein n=1 Tax=Micromonospora pattaloongensis TaxID=405436 RepID=A0A1H3HKG6_9ACTN|nr:hypothetical protein SAMN05444365_101873 [Micromonospora pattaloongensis]
MKREQTGSVPGRVARVASAGVTGEAGVAA